MPSSMVFLIVIVIYYETNGEKSLYNLLDMGLVLKLLIELVMGTTGVIPCENKKCH